MKLRKLTNDHYIITSDDNISEGDWVINNLDKLIGQTIRPISEAEIKDKEYSKITHSTQPLDKDIHGFGYWTKDITPLSLPEVEEAINGYSIEELALQDFKDNDDGFISFQDRIEGFVAGFETHQELVKDNSFAIEILDDIQKDLANYQNEIGIGTMDDVQWQQTFVDRVIASITSYESFSTKTEWDIEIIDNKIKLL